MIAYCGYFAWNCGSEYSEVRTAGRPPSIEVYFWFSTLRRHRMASNASALCVVVLGHRQVQAADRHLRRLAGRHPRVRRETEHLPAGVVGDAELLIVGHERARRR